ncbi:MAG: hypothetical protein HKO90_10795 [Flavobacteriaceae bacterium]|nr:hypothetical protein [Flavobacteriaceae bacterium]
MKIIKFLLMLGLATNFTFAQVDCRTFVPTEKGTKWVYSNYKGKNDKFEGKIEYEVLDKVVDGNDVTFKIGTTTFDKKNKELFNSSYEAKCVDGIFELDMAFKMDGGQLAAYKDMNVDIDASDFELPDLDATPGTTLEDGSLTVRVAAAGGLNINMTVNITERKVEGREQLTTPAGTFDCIVILQKVSTKMLLKTVGYSKEWYAEGIGLVKSESFNKNMKLLVWGQITSLSL